MMDMMDFGWGHMGGGMGIFAVLVWLVLLVDLVLVGIWLFQKISNKK